MRTYRSQKGPFAEQPFFKPEEIESICTDELKRLKLLPPDPQPIRIERFIEKRFGVTPCYEDLPAGVLGLTKFSTKGVEAIIVSRSLADEETKTAERRINTTLAHEAGHGLLHAHLFAVTTQAQQLFGDEFDPKAPKILCRDDQMGASQKPRYDGRWWEFQANQTIGALLLPRALVEKCLAGNILGATGTFGLLQLKPQDRGRAAEMVSGVFNVNPAVARIRLEQLFPESAGAQLTL